jgi:hypothetical protein
MLVIIQFHSKMYGPYNIKYETWWYSSRFPGYVRIADDLDMHHYLLIPLSDSYPAIIRPNLPI